MISAETYNHDYEVAYKFGYEKAEKEHKAMCDSCIHKVSKEDIDAIRADAIDECVYKLALDDETILSDKQYHTLMMLKEQK